MPLKALDGPPSSSQNTVMELVPQYVPDEAAVPMAMGVERLHSPEARNRAVVTSHQGESLTRSVPTRRYADAFGSIDSMEPTCSACYPFNFIQHNHSVACASEV